ncbi:b(0,+)-type amino acid transporter 1-like [Ruditapes philippinarum]|uniref:b(0,+)-type amino acid transporter 1-like n=1 Tax=Ruditapes philippinarum TaxID=129788 RepID=UPI00295C320C|nr:b(0,+)-type amino acid transporter 1-like [Ruditapes philippinarum]
MTELRQRNTNTEIETDVEPVIRLKRNVGITSGISFIVGSIIGSGIFISPKGVLTETGSVGLSLIVWVSSGVLSLLGALSYAELGTMIPKSGGEYPYFMEATFPIVAYLFSWTRTIVLQPSGVAIICMTCASYITTFFEYCGSPAPPLKIIAVIVILTICIINCYDTSGAAFVQVFFTVAKLLAIGIIIIAGFVKLSKGGDKELWNGFEGTTDSPSKIALSFYDAMWAYDGWNTLNYLTEELKNPYRNLPKANVIGVLLVTIVYLLTNISYLAVLGKDGLLNSDAVAVDWGKEMLGDAYIIMPIAVVFSTFGAANGFCFSSARMVYAAAREDHLPEILSYVHVKRYTPMMSVMLTGFIAILMVIPSDVGSLIDFFSFAAWLFYGLAVFCVVILRFTKPNAERPIKVFILIPVIFTLCSIYLVIAPIIQEPSLEFLWAFLFIVGGLLFYFPFVVFKLDRGCFDKVTIFFQLLCEVAPSPYIADKESPGTSGKCES